MRAGGGSIGRGRHRFSASKTSFRASAAEPPGGDPPPRRRPPSSPFRRAATSSARSASCPTRAAPRRRARSTAVLDEIARLAGAGVGEVMLIGQNVNAYHGLGDARRAVGLAGADRAGGRGSRRPARALRDLPSERHERRPDRRPSRRRRRSRPICICRSSPARTAILASMNRRHRVRRLSRHRRAGARRAAGHRLVVGLHRRLSRREPTRNSSATLDARARGRLRLVLRLQIFAAAGNAGRRDGRPGRRSRSRRRGSPNSRRCSSSSGYAFNRGLRRPAARGSVREAWPARGAGRRPVALYAVGARRGPAVARSARWPKSRSWRLGPNSLQRADCLASVVKGGFDRRAGRFEPGSGARERADLKPQDLSPSRIAAAAATLNSTLRESKPAEIAIAFPDNADGLDRFRPLRPEHRPHRARARRFGLRQRQPGRHQGPARSERAGAPRVRDAL